MSYVREAVIEHVRACNEHGNQVRGDELSRLPPRIPVSQIGDCPRQAIFDAARWHPDHPLHVDPTYPFDDYVTEIMEAGNVREHQTGKALASKLNGSVRWKRDDPALPFFTTVRGPTGQNYQCGAVTASSSGRARPTPSGDPASSRCSTRWASRWRRLNTTGSEGTE